MPDPKQQLHAFLTQHYGPVDLTELNRISDGWENDVYSFSYRPADPDSLKKRILRIYPGENAVEKSTHEFTGMRKLFERGFPVPEVLHHTLDAFHKPAVIMRFVEGVSVEDRVREVSPEQGRHIASEFAGLFVHLHTLDVTPFLTPELPDTTFDDPYWFVNGLIQLAGRILTGQMGEAFAPVMAWLRDHAHEVPCERPALMHGDYHDRNVLWTPEHDAVVIDWGNWQIGDYRYDLAWTLLLQGAYGNPQDAVDFLADYERILGHPVENLHFYDVVACTRRLLDMLRVFYLGAEQSGLRPEAGDLIRKHPDHIWFVYEQLCARTNLQFRAIHAMIKAAL